MIVFWAIFLGIVLLLLALDLGVFNREAHTVGVREALGWTFVWVACSLVFNGFVWLAYSHHWFGSGLDPETGAIVKTGGEAAIEFFTGYLVEKSLSIDNIFVIALIFGYFKVPSQYQHRVLFWGILGALIMRGMMIGIGAWMVSQFTWTFYLFGAILAYAAFKILFMKEDDVDPEQGWVLRAARKLLPVSKTMEGPKFTTRVDGHFAFTPLFLVLLVIEVSDVIFAFDSIPAIFGITTDPFIVMTSNVFAILGLRALYFVLAGMMAEFRYLNYALSLVLMFVGVKLVLHDVIKIPNVISLGVIVALLTVGVVASIRQDRKDAKAPKAEPEAAAEADEE
jgi:tellurite resistance protein TerC